jgi:hypothetical protein
MKRIAFFVMVLFMNGLNSGHGMIFTTFEGKRLLIIHHAEETGPRKPQLYEIDDSGDKLILGPRYNPQQPATAGFAARRMKSCVRRTR